MKKIFDKILHQLSTAKTIDQQKAILKDLYLLGKLDAYQKPSTTSSILREMSKIKVIGYHNPWTKISNLHYHKKIGDREASLKCERKGNKIHYGLVLSTNITGHLKIVPMEDAPIIDAKIAAERILLDASGYDCRKIKYI